MRLLSIVAFVGLVSTASLSSPNLAARKTCDPGEGRISVSSGNCMTCPPGAFGLGGSNMCQACPAGSTSDPGWSSCTCMPGYYRTEGGSTTSGACTICPAGKTSGGGATSCTPCRTNTYSVSGGQCTACPSGYTSASGDAQCSKLNCSAGQYASGNSCATCPANKYSNAGATTCNNCPTSTYSTAGSSSCVGCQEGSVWNGSRCNFCPANTYSNGNQCTNCPPGQVSQPGSSTCGPQSSKRAVQPILDTCSSRPGYQRCPVWSSPGGYECINTLTTLDSCGGCVSMPGDKNGSFTGRDCSAIPNVNVVECRRGQCEIASCRKGYALANGACVAMSHSKAKRGALMHARHDSF
ncbi:hypothetical protein FRC12_002295 [Ceratobasidium sp. 428]|nr:hypothetical protein FRC12_002295 [Ceratobasidium sp. 428]